jgi:hypothetical protein
MIARGSKSKLIWVEEVSLGVAPATEYNQVAFVSEDLKEDYDLIESGIAIGSRSAAIGWHGLGKYGGEIQTEFDSGEDCITWLEHLLSLSKASAIISPSTAVINTAYTIGNLVKWGYSEDLYICVWSGTTGGTITLTPISGKQEQGTAQFSFYSPLAEMDLDTYTPQLSLPSAGITFEKHILGGNADLITQWCGGRINSLRLDVVSEDYVSATWNWVFLSGESIGSTVSTSIVATPTVAFTNLDSLVVINGSTRAVTNCSLTIDNNLSNDYVIAEQSPDKISVGNRSVTGSLSIWFEDVTEYNLFVAATSFNLSLFFIYGSSHLEFNMPSAQFFGTNSAAINTAGPIKVDFTFRAFALGATPEINLKRYVIGVLA